MSYPPNQGYPPQQPGYGAYPPQGGGYPPQQQGYPPQGGAYPPQGGAGGYGAPPSGYPPAPGSYPPSNQPNSGGIGFENIRQPPAQNYGPPGGYPPAPVGGGYGAPPQPPTGAYGAPPQPPTGSYGAPPQPATGSYGAPPPPANYYPPSQAGAPVPGGYGAPAPGAYGAASGAYGAPQAQSVGGYGAAPSQAPGGYGSAPSAPPTGAYGSAPPATGQYGQSAPHKGNSNYQASLNKATKAMAAVQIKTHGSVKPYPNFNAEQDAQVLRKAMKGMGTDEKALTNVIGYRTNKQRQEIKTAFKQAYGRDLIKDIKSEVSGNYERLLVGLLTKPAEYDAYCLHKAMSGAGTDESVLIEILASRSNAEIREIKEIYKRDYKKVLEKELQSETSGHFRRLLVSLNNAARDESMTVDHSKAQTDANNLYRAGEKKWGTDEAQFNLVMASRSHVQLRETFQAYHQISNRDITKSLEGEFSGYILKGMLAIVGIARDPPTYFATQFYKSMKGLGTDDDDLIRAAVTRSEVDMEEIKQRFVQLYKQPLSKFISDDVSGDYKKLLLAVVGQ